MEAEQIARVAYKVNAAYCAAIGDDPSLPWEEVRRGMTTAVLTHLICPRSPEQSHALWMAEKLRDGWVYGSQKDQSAKTHPCLVPFEELSTAQRVKDHLFIAVVEALRG